jgi:hypothetical protein
MGGSQAYTLRKQLERSFGFLTGHKISGNFRSLVDNHVTVFKYVNFWTYEKIAKLKDKQVEIREV